jgi:hypothetical protein
MNDIGEIKRAEEILSSFPKYGGLLLNKSYQITSLDHFTIIGQSNQANLSRPIRETNLLYREVQHQIKIAISINILNATFQPGRGIEPLTQADRHWVNGGSIKRIRC